MRFQPTAGQRVSADAESLTIDVPQRITGNSVSLPSTGAFGSAVSWSFTPSGLISDSFAVTHPAQDTNVTLVAEITSGSAAGDQAVPAYSDRNRQRERERQQACRRRQRRRRRNKSPSAREQRPGLSLPQNRRTRTRPLRTLVRRRGPENIFWACMSRAWSAERQKRHLCPWTR